MDGTTRRSARRRAQQEHLDRSSDHVLDLPGRQHGRRLLELAGIDLGRQQGQQLPRTQHRIGRAQVAAGHRRPHELGQRLDGLLWAGVVEKLPDLGTPRGRHHHPVDRQGTPVVGEHLQHALTESDQCGAQGGAPLRLAFELALRLGEMRCREGFDHGDQQGFL
jgi:hypothetical protein